jgi:hypothetical protein
MTFMNESVTAPQAVTPMRELIAEEVRALLARRKMSASELARRMGVSQKYMSRRITGETPLDVDDLDMIATVLGVEPTYFFPRQTEGRVVGLPGSSSRQTTVSKFGPTKRPSSVSGRNGNPPMSTRRPARTGAGHAQSRPQRPIRRG